MKAPTSRSGDTPANKRREPGLLRISVGEGERERSAVRGRVSHDNGIQPRGLSETLLPNRETHKNIKQRRREGRKRRVGGEGCARRETHPVRGLLPFARAEITRNAINSKRYRTYTTCLSGLVPAPSKFSPELSVIAPYT